MLRLESLNDFEWRRLIERLDRAVAAAARDYLRHLHVNRVPIRADKWEEELDELRLAREPDFDKPGLPLVYAMRYMPRRVISILGSILFLDLDGYPTSVLDIGSGPGATALAIDLINAPRHVDLLGIESSREMIVFADTPRFVSRVTARYQEDSFGDGALSRVAIEAADLVVFSATFPYHFGGWDTLLGAIGSYDDNDGRMILAIEPEAKANILESFGRRLRARGWPTETFCCHDLPEIIKRDDIQLKAMWELWKRLGSPGSAPPRTWWNPPNDRFLIANPRPAWPRLSEARVMGSHRRLRPRRSPHSCQPRRLEGHV